VNRALCFTLLGLALVVVLFATGCGGSGGGDSNVSTSDVIDHFRKQTGLRLVRDALISASPGEGLDALVLVDPPRKYGAFTIYVKDSQQLPYAQEHRPMTPDARGIFWDRWNPKEQGWAFHTQGDGHTALAATLYARNLELWWFGKTIGRTDATWKRLDRILSALGKPTTCPRCLSSESAGSGEGQPYRDALQSEEKADYDDAFYACNPNEIADAEAKVYGANFVRARARVIALVAAVYSGGDTDPQAIATGLTNAYSRITSPSERTTRAKAIWHRACLDALRHEPTP
jgi:hypothetical protein